MEETPYVINQPVLVGFLQDDETNPIILGPLPCVQGGSGQTEADYPKKYGSFQGASWSIDKNGAAEIDFPLAQSLTIKIGGNVLCYIKDGEVDLGAPNGDPTLKTTVLGSVLKTFLDSVFGAGGHTHAAGTIPAPSGSVTGPPVGITVTPFETTVVKVK